MAPINRKPDDSFLPARAVWERYGVTSMSLYRWLKDPSVGFPVPVYLGRFRYWKLADLIAWEASRPRTGKPFAAGTKAGAI
jgi:predicted DNA-binding transcriptional regulator AlpA